MAQVLDFGEVRARGRGSAKEKERERGSFNKSTERNHRHSSDARRLLRRRRHLRSSTISCIHLQSKRALVPFERSEEDTVGGTIFLAFSLSLVGGFPTSPLVFSSSLNLSSSPPRVSSSSADLGSAPRSNPKKISCARELRLGVFLVFYLVERIPNAIRSLSA